MIEPDQGMCSLVVVASRETDFIENMCKSWVHTPSSAATAPLTEPQCTDTVDKVHLVSHSGHIPCHRPPEFVPSRNNAGARVLSTGALARILGSFQDQPYGAANYAPNARPINICRNLRRRSPAESGVPDSKIRGVWHPCFWYPNWSSRRVWSTLGLAPTRKHGSAAGTRNCIKS